MANLYIDLTDLIVNSIYHGINTGIQRVQIYVAYSLVNSISARTFSIFEGHWENLDQLVLGCEGDADKFLSAIKSRYKNHIDRYAQRQKHPSATIPLRSFLKLKRLYNDWRVRKTIRFSPGDTIFTMGAFWQYRPLIDFYWQKSLEGVKLIGILHDMIGAVYPEHVEESRQLIFKKFLNLPFHLLTVSDFTKRELERVTKEQIIQSRHKSIKSFSLAHEFVGAERNDMDTKVPAGVNSPYVLYVSSLEPHKNHATLISVWKSLHEELGDKLPQLVLAGKKGDAAASLLEPRSLGSKITFCERPTNEQLKSLYINCVFTIFPSLIEGWGLPVGESLWFGKACAASDCASIPEVGQDLCEYFNPRQPESIKKAVLRLLDPGTRVGYEAKIKSAKLRTWKDVAHDIEAELTSILASG